LFDPTIYENLKTVLEGAVYDLDLNGTILVTQRIDQVDLSSMSRYYSIEFIQTGHDAENTAKIVIQAHLRDLAAEILENVTETPGCTLEILLTTRVGNPQQECPIIQRELGFIWEQRPEITQTLSFMFNEQPLQYTNRIKLHFGRKVGEGQIDDFPNLISFALKSLIWLNERAGYTS
jgi:hypothetical protein